MELIEMVNRLVGKINAVGSSHIDEERYENLKEYCNLFYEMFLMIANESENKNRVEYSMSKSGDKAYETLEVVYEELKHYIEGE
jgi:uncharacterized protein YaaR (DUF327 family)